MVVAMKDQQVCRLVLPGARTRLSFQATVGGRAWTPHHGIPLPGEGGGGQGNGSLGSST